jgi:glycine cleavage system protein P-like pyridoxal-binding family
LKKMLRCGVRHRRPTPPSVSVSDDEAAIASRYQRSVRHWQTSDRAGVQAGGISRDTGVSAQDLGLRAADFGVHYWTSHHALVVPSPCTLEPNESYPQRELDEYARILEHVVNEAHTNPEMVKTAPHNSSIHRVNQEPLCDPLQRAMTWGAYRRRVERV